GASGVATGGICIASVAAAFDAGAGAAPLWFVGGKTTRGLIERELTSTGVSSRDTIFSPWSPLPNRSGTFGRMPSAATGVRILVGELSARMIGGSPLRDVPI